MRDRISPRALVRPAVIVLMLIAAVSGLAFNAFTLLIPKLMAERLTADARLLPLVGAAAFLAPLCGAVTLLLASFALVTFGCALFFRDRREELEPRPALAAAE